MAVTAVIVASGRGSRLRAGCKPLAIVGGVTLLERALATAHAAGIRRYVVVVGSLDGPVASFCRRRRPDVEVVCAPDHARGNGATVVAGLAHAGGSCLVMMVDHLHEPSTLERVLEADGELVFAVDSRTAYVDPDDATLVRREHGAVVAIDKQPASYDTIEATRGSPSAQTAAARDNRGFRPAVVAEGWIPRPRGRVTHRRERLRGRAMWQLGACAPSGSAGAAIDLAGRRRAARATAEHGEKLGRVASHRPTCTVCIDRPQRVAEVWPVIDEVTAAHGIVTALSGPGYRERAGGAVHGSLDLA